MASGILKEQVIHQYKKLISQQKDHLDSLDKEITVTESRIQELKLTVTGGLLKQQGKHSRHRKDIRVLENKLNQDTIKFDEMLCGNMNDREHIPHLLHQKSIACNIEEKFNRQLAMQRNIMEKLGEKFTFAANQSLEAETQMLEAKERIEVETVQFSKRQMHLKTVIDHGTKLLTFMERKLEEVILMEDDEDSKKRKKQQHYQNGVKKLEMYMQAQRTLVEVTGDLRRTDRVFLQKEQKNFAHMNFVNWVHNRRNTLKNCTDKIKSDILFLERQDRGHDEQSQSLLKDLESELEKYSCLADSLEKLTVLQRALDQLKTASNGLLDETLQEAVTVTFDNITHFTSILEDSISNLLAQANNVEDEQMDFPLQDLLLANAELLPECEVVVETERRTPSRSLKSACSDTKSLAWTDSESLH